MRATDIHSHILPYVDDGAKDIDESVALLKLLKEQGITDVFATPHFLPNEEDIYENHDRVTAAYEELKPLIDKYDLPRVFLGYEILYSFGMGKLEGLKDLTIAGSRYILIEFGNIKFDNATCRDISNISDMWDLVPIVAHIERYKYNKGFDKLLDLVKKGVCRAQINATSLSKEHYKKTTYKLIKKGLVTYVGSDAHSVDKRPPKIDEAYKLIAEKFGEETAESLIENGNKIVDEILSQK